MAFGKKFESIYKSSNGDTYTLEFWVDGFGGSSSEVSLGPEGCVIDYQANGDKKYTSIIASSIKIPLVVSNATINTFITELREVFEEKEVYVHLYNSHDSSIPLWSGYVIMDLSSQEDVPIPYIVELKAVDGIALLKDVDFVRSGSTLPYDKADSWSGTYKRCTDWIKEILENTGMGLAAQGGSNYTFQTSVNWYNQEHTGTSQTDDPLYLTRCKMDSFYTIDEEENYTPKSYYDVLKSMCKSWGMRCVYWNNVFHFVQISEYSINESGTLANPINIPTREYYYTGGLRLTQAYIGSKELARYELDFENLTTNYGLQKLAGSQYNHYPVIKKVVANFNVLEDQNYFNGFPLLRTSYVDGVDYFETTAISTFVDAYNIDGFYCQIPLMMSNDLSALNAAAQLDVQCCWTIRAREVGNPTWEKMYLAQSTGGAFAGWNAYNEAYIEAWPEYYTNFYQVQNMTAGNSQRMIFDSGGLTAGVIPTDAGFIGEWEFEFMTYSYASGQNMTGHGGVNVSGFNAPGMSIPWDIWNTGLSFEYSNITNTNISPPFEGLFVPIAGGVIGSNSTTYNLQTSTSDSYIFDLKDLTWGESLLGDASSALQVWDGVAWVFASFAGEWGVGTTAGSFSFVKLLGSEIINNQESSSLKLGGASALSETDKEESGHPKFLNPISKLIDLDNKSYVMLRGRFTTGNDEWNGEWFQMGYDTATTTTVIITNDGRTSGALTGGGNTGTVIGGPMPGPI